MPFAASNSSYLVQDANRLAFILYVQPMMTKEAKSLKFIMEHESQT
jgi:hypothetical protein